MAVDIGMRRLVLVDDSRGTLEVVKYDGTERRVICKLSGLSFRDVTVFKVQIQHLRPGIRNNLEQFIFIFIWTFAFLPFGVEYLVNNGM